MTLITGGVRSGKSRYAEGLCRERGDKTLYLATGTGYDSLMQEKIRRSQKNRSMAWVTREGYVNLEQVIKAEGNRYDSILLDSVTSWVADHMKLIIADDPGISLRDLEKRLLSLLSPLLDAAIRTSAEVFLVTNEVGFSFDPATERMRRFVEAMGRVNQHLAAACNRVVFVWAGLPVQLK